MEINLDTGFTAGVTSAQEKALLTQQQDIECAFVNEGYMTYLLRAEPITVSAGRWVVFWNAVPHHLIYAQDNARIYWVTISLKNFLSWGLPALIVNPVMDGQMVLDVRGDIKLDEALVKRWSYDLDLNDPQREAIVALEVEARLRRLSLYANIAQTGDIPFTTSDKPMRRFVLLTQMEQYISEYYIRPIGIEQVAESVELTPEQANALFKRYFRTTISETINHYRIGQAQHLLVATDLSLRSIGQRCGFKSMSVFYEIFRSVCHITPKAYRTLYSIL